MFVVTHAQGSKRSRFETGPFTESKAHRFVPASVGLVGQEAPVLYVSPALDYRRVPWLSPFNAGDGALCVGPRGYTATSQLTERLSSLFFPF